MIAHPDTLREIEEHRASLWTPPPDESICAWAERNIFLGPRITESPGYFSLNSRPYLRGILETVQDRGVSDITLCAATQTGKALALDTPIPTPDGWTTMGALKVGDTVFDMEGRPTQVRFATEVMHGHACYRVTLGNGDSVVADADHQWVVDRSVQCGVGEDRRYEVIRHVETTQQLYAAKLQPRWKAGTARIPLAQPLDFRVAAKQARVRASERPRLTGSHEIASIEPVPSVPVRCIQVDSPSHTFLCTSSMIPTHNSSVAMIAMAYTVAVDPGPVVFVMPSRDLCLSFSRDRWQPVVEDSATLAAEKPQERFKFTTLTQYFKRCSVTFRGAGSANQLASISAKLLILDECSKYKEATKREAGAVKLAEHRTDSYSFSKTLKLSTPTIPGDAIMTAYLAGDRRRYFVPCFHCGVFQTLEWRFVRWDDHRLPDGSRDLAKIKQSARYECPHCKGRIGDAEKLSMIRRGEWRATNPAAIPGRVSFHLSALYALTTKTSFGALTVKFLEAKDSVSGSGMQDFINSVLAESYANQAVDAEQVLVSPPDAPPLPEAIPLMTVDVQEKSPLFWFVVRLWDKAGNSRLLTAGHCDDWETVARVRLAYGVEPHHTGVDSGYATTDVYTFCVQHGKALARPTVGTPLWVGVIPMRGRERDALWLDAKGKRPSPFFYGRAALPPNVNLHLPLLEHNTAAASDILARLRAGKTGIRWEISELPSKLEVPGAVMVHEEEYLRHLSSMIRKPVVARQTGKVRYVWARRSSGAQNHLHACEVMQTVLAIAHRRLNVYGKTEVEADPAGTSGPAQPDGTDSTRAR